MNSTTLSCAACGAALAPGATGGVCPQCEFATALDDHSCEAALSLNGISAAERRFDNYELIEEIAQGGMGVVYKARHLKLKRIVALKMILAGQFANREQVMRFRAEAEAAATLRHPNIVTIYETGEFDGQPYFTMDYIEGHNLAELIQGATLPAPSVAPGFTHFESATRIDSASSDEVPPASRGRAKGLAGPLPIRRAVEYLRKIADAVHHAH